MNENEEFEFRARAEKEAQTKPSKKMGGSPPLGFVAKQIWNIAPQNPKNELKNLPLAAGALGGAGPMIGGGIMGTGIGQIARYAGDKAFKQPVPSVLQHALELGGAAFGDAVTAPGKYGARIGAAEKAAGLGAVEKEAPPASIRTAVKFVNQIKDKDLTPETAKQFKPAIDTIFKKGWLRGTEYEPDLVQVSKKIQSTLNTIPGRAEPSAGLAKMMYVPNKIRDAYQILPKGARQGIAWGSGAVGAGGVLAEVMKKLLGQ